MTHKFAFVALLLVALGSSIAHAAERPNILFIFTDDHAYQAMSCYGHKLNETPNIDRIGARGCASTTASSPTASAGRAARWSSRANTATSTASSTIAASSTVAANVSEAVAGGRLSNGRDRQVAPRFAPDGLRPLANPARARAVLQPADAQVGRAASSITRATRPTSSPTCRSIG